MEEKKLLNEKKLKELYHIIIDETSFIDKSLSDAYEIAKKWFEKIDALPVEQVDKLVIESMLLNRIDKMEKIKIEFLFGTTDTGRVNRKIIKNNPYLKKGIGENIQLVELGHAMKLKKDKMKLTLKEMSNQVGLDSPTLHRYMKGEMPNIKSFIKVCKWLELEPGTVLNLLFETENNNG